MKQMIIGFILIFSTSIFAEEAVPSSAEEVPVPSFINLDSVDLSAAPEQHEVVSGDTLWDISATYLKSPWYWPKVWSLNPQINNPHLIYPGDIISFRLTGEMMLPNTGIEGSGGAFGGSEFEDEGETDVLARTGKTLDATPENFKEFVKLGGKYRIDRFKQIDDTLFDTILTGYIGDDEKKDLGKVVGAYEPKELLSTEDNVYVKLGEVSYEAGEYVEFVNIKKRIEHPKTGKKIGVAIDIVGLGKVLDVNDDKIATVKITKAYDSIDRGYYVRKYVPTESTIPITESANDIKATIITGYDPTVYYGHNFLVYIDKGSKDGVEKGNMLSVYRRGDGLNELDSDVSEDQLPFELIGELVVMHVSEENSTAIITNSLTALEAGDSAIAGIIE